MEFEKTNKPVRQLYLNGKGYKPYTENGNLYIPMTFCSYDCAGQKVLNHVYYLEIPHNVLTEAIQMQTYNE